MDKELTIILDLDGTIANCEWRLDFIKTKPKNWPAFHKGTRKDGTHDDILYLVKLLQANGARIIICTGREEVVKEDTTWWLENVAKLKYDAIYMRPKGDHRPDTIIKKELLDRMREDGYNPVMAFEDRKRVAQMFRGQGIRVLHVVEGDF